MRRIGVLWSGDHMFPRIPETIQMLRKKGTLNVYPNQGDTGAQIGAGKQLVFVTNNSTKSRADYKKKFDKMGIEAYEVGHSHSTSNRFKTKVGQEEVFGSSYSAAIYISRILKLQPPKNKVYVLGETGVEQELESENIRYIGGTDKSLQREMSPDDYTSIADESALDEEVAVVLTGLDFHPSYLKYSLGMAYLRRGATFLATNIDSTLPNAGSLFPGAGSTSAPLVKATGKEPLALGNRARP